MTTDEFRDECEETGEALGRIFDYILDEAHRFNPCLAKDGDDFRAALAHSWIKPADYDAVVVAMDTLGELAARAHYYATRNPVSSAAV